LIDTVADKQEVTLRSVIDHCTPEVRRVARMWLFYTLFYWTFPTLIVIFGLLIAQREVHPLDLIIHGEFLIYSITIVAGSTRLISKDMSNRGPFVNRQGFNLVSHIMIFPAIFTYGLLRYIAATADPKNPYPVSAPLVVVYSIVLLIAAFRFSYVVFLIDAQRSAPEELPKKAVIAIARSHDKLDADFDKLQEEDPEVKPDDGPQSAPPEPAPAPPKDQTQKDLEEGFDSPQDEK
jgi:hypothetical protein